MPQFYTLTADGPKRAIEEFLAFANRPGTLVMVRGIYEVRVSVPAASTWLYLAFARRVAGLRVR